MPTAPSRKKAEAWLWGWHWSLKGRADSYNLVFSSTLWGTPTLDFKLWQNSSWRSWLRCWVNTRKRCLWEPRNNFQDNSRDNTNLLFHPHSWQQKAQVVDSWPGFTNIKWPPAPSLTNMGMQYWGWRFCCITGPDRVQSAEVHDTRSPSGAVPPSPHVAKSLTSSSFRALEYKLREGRKINIYSFHSLPSPLYI